MTFLFKVTIVVGCLSIGSLFPTGVFTDLVRAQTAAPAAAPAEASIPKALIGAWQLTQKAEKGGPAVPVSQNVLRVMKFSQDGRIVSTRTPKDNPAKSDSRPGKFSVQGTTLSITDDEGHTAQCQYRIEGDTLVMTFADIQREYRWQRVK